MGKVIYLTGAPATGKSSLCTRLASAVPGLIIYSYSALLRDYVNARKSIKLDEVDVRRQSSNIITRDDVEAVDQSLLDAVANERRTRHIVIDSHPVTKESFGFRVTAFAQSQLQALAPDVILCLYADPQTLGDRITRAPSGRPLPSEFELRLHVELQAAVASQYAVLLGKPLYLLDSAVGLDLLVERAIAVAHLGVKA